MAACGRTAAEWGDHQKAVILTCQVYHMLCPGPLNATHVSLGTIFSTLDTTARQGANEARPAPLHVEASISVCLRSAAHIAASAPHTVQPGCCWHHDDRVPRRTLIRHWCRIISKFRLASHLPAFSRSCLPSSRAFRVRFASAYQPHYSGSTQQYASWR